MVQLVPFLRKSFQALFCIGKSHLIAYSLDNNMPNNRIYYRQLYKDRCLLSNRNSCISAQSSDISRRGLGMLVTDETLCIKKGDMLFIKIITMQKISRVEVRWTNKNGNATRVGFKLFCSLPYFPQFSKIKR